MTTPAKGYPLEVPVAAAGVAGVVLADHLKSVDWRAHRASRAARVSDETIGEVLERIRPLLAL